MPAWSPNSSACGCEAFSVPEHQNIADMAANHQLLAFTRCMCPTVHKMLWVSMTLTVAGVRALAHSDY